MYSNFIFDDINEALPDLMYSVVNGDEIGSRVGRTKEMTHVGTTLLKPWRREILHPGRKANIAAQIAETMWVLSGRNDVEWLSHYLPRAADFSDDGETWRAGYGPRLRKWQWEMSSNGQGTDQLAEVVRLLKDSIGTRRAVMSIWDAHADYGDSKDIPCNNWINFSSRLGKLDMHVAIRSNDLMWGWSGINAFEWSALQEIVANLVGVGVGALHFSTTSLHLYDRHWGKADEMAKSEVLDDLQDSPRFNWAPGNLVALDLLIKKWFDLEQAIRTGGVDAPFDADKLVDEFPEPMLQSWLRVLQWWWTDDADYLEPLQGTRLERGTQVAVQPKRAPKLEIVQDVGPGKVVIGNFPSIMTPFMEHVQKLHIEKHEAYGDSWKRRGEMLGIMANIARKVDRLGSSETADETSADTAIDLMVYLAKYRWWLVDNDLASDPLNSISFDKGVYSDDPAWANALMASTEQKQTQFGMINWNLPEIEKRLTAEFDHLEKIINGDRYVIVDGMLDDAYVLSRSLWEAEQAPVDRNATRSWNPEMPSHDH